MTTNEAADVIRSMSQSLASQPGQFKITVNVTGQQVTSYGGTSLNISAVGGASGSKTIGQSVAASGGSMQIQQGQQAFDAAMRNLVDTLNCIATELEVPSPDKSKINSVYKSLLGTWVPGVITSVIGNVLSAAIGLSAA